MGCVETIHQTIREIYHAAIAPDDWPVAVGAIAAMIGTHRGMLLVSGSKSVGLAIATGFSPEHAQSLRREFETRLPDWIGAIPVRSVLRQSSAISDSDFRRSDIYNEAIRPAGGFYGIVAPLVRAPTQQCYFSAGRDEGARDFTEQDAKALSLIVPHLVSALEVRDHLAASDQRNCFAYEAFGQLNVGVILLDASMRAVFVNARAEAIAATFDGLLFRGNGISASRPEDARTLEAMLARAVAFNNNCRDASESAVGQQRMRCHLSRRPPRPPLVVSVVPVPCSSALNRGNSRVRVLLFVVEPDRPPGHEPVTAGASFRLTPRESQLAALLASGLALTEAASQIGIGVGTARGYLKQTLAKTGTHRQGELVSLLLRGGMQVTR